MKQKHTLQYLLKSTEKVGDCLLWTKCLNSDGYPRCINPEHLLSGTHTDNMRDRDTRERHGSAKLTHKQVREIRELSMSSSLLQREIAEMYGVHKNTINSIILNNHFKLCANSAEGN